MSNKEITVEEKIDTCLKQDLENAIAYAKVFDAFINKIFEKKEPTNDR